VQLGVARIGAVNGEVWFKLDRASAAGIARVNGVQLTPARVKAALLKCAALAPTWLQTCFFALDGDDTAEAEQAAYLEFVASVRNKIEGVHLYGLARPSLQPEAVHLKKMTPQKFQHFAQQISALGIEVIASPPRSTQTIKPLFSWLLPISSRS
jgi:hypothetical protein